MRFKELIGISQEATKFNGKGSGQQAETTATTDPVLKQKAKKRVGVYSGLAAAIGTTFLFGIKDTNTNIDDQMARMQRGIVASDEFPNPQITTGRVIGETIIPPAQADITPLGAAAIAGLAFGAGCSMAANSLNARSAPQDGNFHGGETHSYRYDHMTKSYDYNYSSGSETRRW